MPKKTEPPTTYKESKPNPQSITDTLELNFMPYAMSVIMSRAIPAIDGFKPAHRKLLYTMYKMGLLTGARMKSADVVGTTMRLNPHGDGAIYETLVRLTRGNDTLLHPFVDSKGNFGKVYSRDMAYAAARYTEVKLDGVCSEIFRDIDKNTVDFTDNYNGTMKEPVLLPTVYPNLLVTPNQGIAVSMANAVPSFNLKEICTATIAYIKDKKADFLKLISAPDFSTGGELIYDEDALRAIYETGRGSVRLRARYRFDKKNSCIEIYEIPYTTTVEAIIDKIVSLVKSGKIKDITDIRDETDLNGLKIAIDIRKAADPEQLMKRLFASTTLMDSFSCNFNFLIDGRPKTMGIREILDNWLAFRIGCIKRRVNFDLDELNKKAHLLTGLKQIILDIDKAIQIIRNTQKDKDVVPNLADAFGIDLAQAEYIAEIKLRNINKEYLLNRINELDKLNEDIKSLTVLLGSDVHILNLIINELKEIVKKHSKPRRTEIVYILDETKPSAEMFIDDYPVRLFLTKHNYFKKIPLTSLRSSGEQYLKDGDEIILEVDATNKSDILFFSNKQNVYKMKAHEIPDCKASVIGEYLCNLLKSDENEHIIYAAVTVDYSGYMLFGFENGKIAKVTMENYATKTNRKKLINAYSDKSPLVFAEYTVVDKDYAVVRSASGIMDKAILLNSSLLPALSVKNSAGVQVLTLKKNSDMSKVIPADLFKSADAEHYRTDKIPSSGHFMTERDKSDNGFVN